MNFEEEAQTRKDLDSFKKEINQLIFCLFSTTRKYADTFNTGKKFLLDEYSVVFKKVCFGDYLLKIESNNFYFVSRFETYVDGSVGYIPSFVEFDIRKDLPYALDYLSKIKSSLDQSKVLMSNFSDILHS